MYYFVKTVPLDIMGTNEDTPLKEYNLDTHTQLFNNVVSGQILRERPEDGDTLYFLFKEEDAHWVDLLKVDTVEEVEEIPDIFTTQFNES